MRWRVVALLAALAICGQDLQAASPACKSSQILARLWQSSLGAVEGALSSAQRREAVDLARLEHDVTVLAVISGIDAQLTHFGYLPDDALRRTVAQWKAWEADGGLALCACPQGAPTATEPGVRPAGAESHCRDGCAGSQRLTRLWLANVRSLDRIVQDLVRHQPIDDGRVDAVVGFFQQVTGLPADTTARKRGAAAMIELMGLDRNWEDWFVANSGSLCGPPAPG